MAALFASPLTAFDEDAAYASSTLRFSQDGPAAETAASSFDPLQLGYDGELRTVLRKARNMHWAAPKRLGLVLCVLLLMWVSGGPFSLLGQAAMHSYALAAGVLTGTATVTSVATSVLSAPATPSPSPSPPPTPFEPVAGSMQHGILQAAEHFEERMQQYQATAAGFNMSAWVSSGWASSVAQSPAYLWMRSFVRRGAAAVASAGIGVNTQEVHATWVALRQQRWEAQALVLLCVVFLCVQGGVSLVACARRGLCTPPSCCTRGGALADARPHKPVSPDTGVHHGLDSALFGSGEAARHRRNAGRLDTLSPLLKESGVLPPSASPSRRGSGSGEYGAHAFGLDATSSDLGALADAAHSGLHSHEGRPHSNEGGAGGAFARRTSAFRNTHRRTRTSALLGQWAAAAVADTSPTGEAGSQGMSPARPPAAAMTSVFAALHMSRLAAAKASRASSAHSSPRAASPPPPVPETAARGTGDAAHSDASSAASSKRSLPPPEGENAGHRRTATTQSLLRTAWTSSGASPERQAASSPPAPPSLDAAMSSPGQLHTRSTAGKPHKHRRSATLAQASAAFASASAAASTELPSAPAAAAQHTEMLQQVHTASDGAARGGRSSTVAARHTEAVFDAFSPAPSPPARAPPPLSPTEAQWPGAPETAASISTAVSSDPRSADGGALPPVHSRSGTGGSGGGSASWAHLAPAGPAGGSVRAPSDVGSSASAREARGSARAARRRRMAAQLAALAGDDA